MPAQHSDTGHGHELGTYAHTRSDTHGTRRPSRPLSGAVNDSRNTVMSSPAVTECVDVSVAPVCPTQRQPERLAEEYAQTINALLRQPLHHCRPRHRRRRRHHASKPQKRSTECTHHSDASTPMLCPAHTHTHTHAPFAKRLRMNIG